MFASDLLSVGEFARLTHLTSVTLRHYHEKGLLPPADVDDVNGYRWYSPGQIDDALLLSRLRGVGLPIEAMREVIDTADGPDRNRVLDAKLAELDAVLSRNRRAVRSLRRLLAGPGDPPVVQYREDPDISGWAITATVDRAEIAEFCQDGFGTLHTGLMSAGVAPAGPAVAAYDEAFFEAGTGEVALVVPTNAPLPQHESITRWTIGAARRAVALHRGSYDDFDLTYSALGRYVNEHATSAPGPIVEFYLVGPDVVDDESAQVTEIHWPLG